MISSGFLLYKINSKNNDNLRKGGHMRDNRKSIKVPPAIKAELVAIQKELKLSTEGEAIAYLQVMYRLRKETKITLAEHLRYMKQVEEIINQASL
ncbi:hypothetical protein [Paenibacillus sp. FSL L8-0463]|uniref:hypothetical protein n=1 Tax=Paenibacillus sp. FSL L8-0463 TaxID=2954687 RepID=UPI00311A2DBC